MKILVLSDIHANADALAAVLDDAGEYGEIWSLGDVVGYGAEPARTIELLFSGDRTIRSVAGNHDLGVLGRLSLSGFIPEGRQAIEWTQPRLDESDLARLDSPSELTIGTDASLWHGGPINPVWGYVNSPEKAQAAFSCPWVGFGFVGHTHQPRAYFQSSNYEATEGLSPRPGWRFGAGTFGERALLNPGSVGQPRDGDPRAAYLLCDLDAGWFEWRRTRYDIKRSQQKIKAAGLPETLADRLGFGL